jgi:hypothetical protein
VSRRPRAPLPLRALAREPSVSPALAVDPGETQRLPDPEPPTWPVALAPSLAGSLHPLVSDLPPARSLALAPVVDVMPATLAGAVFALRRVELRFPLAKTEQTPRFAAESRGVPIPLLQPTRRAEPAAVLTRRARPMVLEQIDRAVLRECLEELFRASGAPTPDDLALVGVYDRVPVGAIAGAAATRNGLELHLRPGVGARRGLLVVGRRRSSGALVTAEVPRS